MPWSKCAQKITREGEHGGGWGREGGGDNGSREKEGKEKSGQKHRSKHLKDH